MTGLLDLAVCTVMVLAAAGVILLTGLLLARAWDAVDRYLDRHIDTALAGANNPHARRAARGDDWFSA